MYMNGHTTVVRNWRIYQLSARYFDCLFLAHTIRRVDSKNSCCAWPPSKCSNLQWNIPLKYRRLITHIVKSESNHKRLIIPAMAWASACEFVLIKAGDHFRCNWFLHHLSCPAILHQNWTLRYTAGRSVLSLFWNLCTTSGTYITLPGKRSSRVPWPVFQKEDGGCKTHFIMYLQSRLLKIQQAFFFLQFCSMCHLSLILDNQQKNIDTS